MGDVQHEDDLGCYSGRWPHIHFEVFDSLESGVAGANARLTSQIALPEDACKSVFAYKCPARGDIVGKGLTGLTTTDFVARRRAPKRSAWRGKQTASRATMVI